MGLVLVAALLPSPARAEPRGIMPDEPAEATQDAVVPTERPKVELPKNLDEVERRLNHLESRIKRKEKLYAANQVQLTEISGEVDSQRGNLIEVRKNLRATKVRMAASEARLGDLRRQINGRARSLYKRGGPLELMGVLFDAGSMRDFVGRVGYAADVANSDRELFDSTRHEQDSLKRVQTYQVRLERRQTKAVRLLRARQVAIGDVFARQQLVLSDLASDRAAVLFIADELTGKIGPGAISALRKVAGKGMTITYEEWARQLLTALGAPVVLNNIITVVAWQSAEGTQATWNPLATTMNAEGATNFNDVGVKNFVSMESGVEATINTLTRGSHGYDMILDGLERAAPSMETGHWIQQSHWCHGCAEGGYVVGIIPAVEQYYTR
jgi:peptidoglycan hydrolase CwlO-like protein